MSKMYNTSLYAASISDGTIPTRIEIREDLWKQIKQFAKEKKLLILEDKQHVSSNNTEISFTVIDLPTEKLYFFSFQPTGKVSFWGKASEKAAQDVLGFCDSLGPEIQTSTKPRLLFRRIQLSNQDRIDISEWSVICPFTKPASKTSLREFLSHTLYENVFSAIPKELQFHVFSETYSKGAGPFLRLRENLSVYGKVFGPNSISTAKEFSENIASRTRENSIFVFLENTAGLDQHYEKDKIYYDSNRVPTQYVSDGTVESKLQRFRGVDANLILEMLTKMGKQPLILQAPEEIFVNDGFLCLSDISSVHHRLFGAIFTYSKQGLERLREDVQIYDDIEFETPTDYSLDIDDENLTLLAKKVNTLVGRKLKIDILLTKRWKEANIEKLIEILRENNVETKKVYYISSRTCRFVDEYLQDSSNYRSFNHPFKIVGKKIAFLKTCTETRIYPNLFSLFIELVWPLNAQLTQGDLEKILWLSKKRIYRIQEFHILKNPEPIYVFRNLRKMYIGRIKEKLTIPLRLLI